MPRVGEPLFGIVSDPNTKGIVWASNNPNIANTSTGFLESGADQTSKIIFYSDQSIKDHSSYKKIAKFFNIKFEGGAVSNAISVTKTPRSVYFKLPKTTTGGCAIWDLAAVYLIAKEKRMRLTSFYGDILNFNKKESLYFNREGIMLASCENTLLEVKDILTQIEDEEPT